MKGYIIVFQDEIIKDGRFDFGKKIIYPTLNKILCDWHVDEKIYEFEFNEKQEIFDALNSNSRLRIFNVKFIKVFDITLKG